LRNRRLIPWALAAFLPAMNQLQLRLYAEAE